MEKEAPHHLGHRQRLKERVREKGAQSLADYELLELLLTYAIPRRDVKPQAKSLLTAQGSLSNLFGTTLEKLIEQNGLGEHSAILVHLISEAAKRYRKEQASGKDAVLSRLEMIDYLYTKLTGLPHEEFHVLHLDSKNHLISDELLFRGTLNAATVYPREVVKSALEKGSAGLVIAHNHPSGDPTPSEEDRLLTSELSKICTSIGILLHDHLIIGASQHYSFRDKGAL